MPLLSLAAALSLASCEGSSRVDIAPTGANLPQEEGATQPSPRRALTADEQAVFPALDLNRPELAALAAALQNGDPDAASRAWHVHLRERQGLNWGGAGASLPESYNARVADDAVEGRVRGGFLPLVHAFPEGKIDWLHNATGSGTGQAANPEWQWQLNRMMFWPEMAKAYALTRDEKYPRAFARQLHSWLEQCPASADMANQVGSAWRTIEAGIRLGQTWPRSFSLFIGSPSLSDADIMAYTRSLLEHATYLRRFQSSGNWVLMEMQGLAAAGCFFPEFREAAEWRSFAFERLAKEAERQFLPDGAHYELSPGYHDYVALSNFAEARDIARWTGQEAAMPADYDRRLEKAFEWLMYMSAPGGKRPLFNDTERGRIAHNMARGTKIFPARDDFRWFASEGVEGRPPPARSIFLDWSGFALMRSGWDAQANYLVFRVGPLGGGHWHQDNLDVILWPYGRELLFHGSGGPYENSKWRAWAISSLAANCVSVDGLAQARGKDDKNTLKDPNQVSQEPIDAGWESTADYDYATGVYDKEYGELALYGTNGTPPASFASWGQLWGFKNRRLVASNRRSVLFLKPDLYLVADVLTPFDEGPHTYQARWQLLTTRTRLDPQSLAVTTEDQGQPNLVIAPLLKNGLTVDAASARETPELLGWDVRNHATEKTVPATTVLQNRAGAGVQRFITLFVPLKPGAKNPLTRITQTGDTASEVRFDDGRQLNVSIDDAGGIHVRETLPDGAPGRVIDAGSAKDMGAHLPQPQLPLP